MAVHIARAKPTTPALPQRCYYQSLTNKIRYITNEFCWFYKVPDIGMDRYLVSEGTPLGTGGLGPCFAVCSIGKTSFQTPILGLCHTSSVMPIKDVLHKLKDSMTAKGAVRNTIETYVIGGEIPSEANDGTLEEEEEIKALAEQENIKGVLFNLAQGEEVPLNVVLTPENVYVSINNLFDSSPIDEGHRILKV
jgi:hypothetical protein